MLRIGIPQAAVGLLVGAFLAVTAPLASGITLSHAVMTSAVVDREPVDGATSFPADVGQIVCFTRIASSEETVIYHAWRHGDTLRAKVQLSVGKSSSWRTWSTKRINPSWTGAWTVDVEDADGKVLRTLTFTIGDDGADR